MELVISVDLEDGEPHMMVIGGAGHEWRDAFEAKRTEDPGALLTFEGTLDGGWPQMWALRAGSILGMEVTGG